MKDLAALKNRILVAAATGGDGPYEILNDEFAALEEDLGELVVSHHDAHVRFDLNGYPAVLSFGGPNETPAFMLQTDQVSAKPFMLRDASDFARIAAAEHLAELCDVLLREHAKATEAVAHAIRVVKSVRDALKSA